MDGLQKRRIGVTYQKDGSCVDYAQVDSVSMCRQLVLARLTISLTLMAMLVVNNGRWKLRKIDHPNDLGIVALRVDLKQVKARDVMLSDQSIEGYRRH